MDKDVLAALRGKFIVFDGVDGAGKGAQIKLLTEALTAASIDFVSTRDPGGTPIGDRIRHVLLDYDLTVMDIRCETLLFMASRAQLARDVLRPAIERGAVCICDRFVSATCAYQGAAGADPRTIMELAKHAVGDCWPNLTLVVDLPVDVALERTGRKAGTKKKPAAAEGQFRLFHDSGEDAMEARPLDFHQRVRERFLELPTYYPTPIAIVDGRGSVAEVEARVTEAIRRALC